MVRHMVSLVLLFITSWYFQGCGRVTLEWKMGIKNKNPECIRAKDCDPCPEAGEELSVCSDPEKHHVEVLNEIATRGAKVCDRKTVLASTIPNPFRIPKGPARYVCLHWEEDANGLKRVMIKNSEVKAQNCTRKGSNRCSAECQKCCAEPETCNCPEQKCKDLWSTGQLCCNSESWHDMTVPVKPGKDDGATWFLVDSTKGEAESKVSFVHLPAHRMRSAEDLVDELLAPGWVPKGNGSLATQVSPRGELQIVAQRSMAEKKSAGRFVNE